MLVGHTRRSLESGWDKTVVLGGKPLKLKVRMRVCYESYLCKNVSSSGRPSLTIITNHPPPFHAQVHKYVKNRKAAQAQYQAKEAAHGAEVGQKRKLSSEDGPGAEGVRGVHSLHSLCVRVPVQCYVIEQDRTTLAMCVCSSTTKPIARKYKPPTHPLTPFPPHPTLPHSPRSTTLTCPPTSRRSCRRSSRATSSSRASPRVRGRPSTSCASSSTRYVCPLSP